MRQIIVLLTLFLPLAQATAQEEMAGDCATCGLDAPIVHLNADIWLKGIEGLTLHNVKIVAPDTDIPVVLPSEIENAIEFIQTNDGATQAIKTITASKPSEFDNTALLEASATAISNLANIDVTHDLALETIQATTDFTDAQLDVSSGLGGTTNLTATAIANALNASTTGSAVFDVSQSSTGLTITATLDADIFGGGVGEVDTSATAIANIFNLEIDGNASGFIDQRNTADLLAINTDIIDVLRDPATSTTIANLITITRTAR